MACINFAKLAKHKAAIYQKSLATDDYGGSTNTWTEVSTVWAIVEPLSGFERMAHGANDSQVQTKVTVRHISSLKDTATAGKTKMVIDGVTYSVEFVKNFSDDWKTYGHAYQAFYCKMSGAEIG